MRGDRVLRLGSCQDLAVGCANRGTHVAAVSIGDTSGRPFYGVKRGVRSCFDRSLRGRVCAWDGNCAGFLVRALGLNIFSNAIRHVGAYTLRNAQPLACSSLMVLK